MDSISLLGSQLRSGSGPVAVSQGVWRTVLWPIDPYAEHDCQARSAAMAASASAGSAGPTGTYERSGSSPGSRMMALTSSVARLSTLHSSAVIGSYARSVCGDAIDSGVDMGAVSAIT